MRRFLLVSEGSPSDHLLWVLQKVFRDDRRGYETIVRNQVKQQLGL